MVLSYFYISSRELPDLQNIFSQWVNKKPPYVFNYKQKHLTQASKYGIFSEVALPAIRDPVLWSKQLVKGCNLLAAVCGVLEIYGD